MVVLPGFLLVLAARTPGRETQVRWKQGQLWPKTRVVRDSSYLTISLSFYLATVRFVSLAALGTLGPAFDKADCSLSDRMLQGKFWYVKIFFIERNFILTFSASKVLAFRESWKKRSPSVQREFLAVLLIIARRLHSIASINFPCLSIVFLWSDRDDQ